VVAEAVATIFDVTTCGIILNGGHFHDQPRMAIHSTVARDSFGNQRFPLAQIASIELSAPEIIRDVMADPRLQQIRSSLDRVGIAALALAPLISAGRQIGMVAINATERVEQFGHGERALLETIASLVTQVLENARLYREVEDERSTLNTVLRGAADPILLIDRYDRLLLANRAAVERFHLADGIGHPIASLNLHEDLRVALSAGSAKSGVPHEVMLADGATFSISVASVQGADTTVIGRVAVIQDISAIKELERREQQRLRDVFRRYVSPQVVEEVLAGGGNFGDPAERTVVVVFADIRGYTTITEGLPAKVLVEQILNRYFNGMTEALYRHDGMVDKFLGDGIIGLFGVPIARPDDIQRSLLATVEMQRTFAVLQRSWREELQLDIGMSIGVGYGTAVVGNIGTAQRLDYTVIGDVVNTASRLNGLAIAGQIVVSHRLVEALPPNSVLPGVLRERGLVVLKGKHEPHLVYDLEYE
jgi:adenylate cyclase